MQHGTGFGTGFLLLAAAWCAACGTSQQGSYPQPLPPPETLEENMREDGFVFAAGTEVQRDYDGRVRKGTIAQARTVAGVRLPAGTVVWLDAGRVLQARPPERVGIGGIEAAARAPIRFALPKVWDTFEVCLAEPHGRYPAGVFVELRWSGDEAPARIVGRSDIDTLMEEANLGAGCR
ncbi:MAG: hypothetical protein ACOC5B_04245 [Myxococcota bacterium]